MNKKISVFAVLIAATFLSSGCGQLEENTNIAIKPDVVLSDSAQASEEQTGISSDTVTAAMTESAESVIQAGGEPEESEDTQTQEVATEKNENKTPVEEQTPAPAPVPEAVPEYQPPEEETEPTYIQGVLIANKTYALPSSFAPGCISTETQNAFDAMNQDAAAEGLNLWIASGYRSYELQESLYNRYVNRDGKDEADTYSARPGHSEHQTGLAFDLNSIDSSFGCTAEGIWVAENCYKYGFIIRYPSGKESQTGYQYEPWHLRYLGVTLATEVYNSGLCLEEYLGITSQYSD